MRIGTWNVAGRWTKAHGELVLRLDCDVWLLTEVSERLSLPGYELHPTHALMAPRRRWAGIASRSGLTAMPDPHPATAMATAGGLVFASSILPWRSCGERPPWGTATHAAKTVATLERLREALRAVHSTLVWGGDWNHALRGEESAGSMKGREAIAALVDELQLAVPTGALPHRIENRFSIDHIAVPRPWRVASAERVVARQGEQRLSDHEVYVVNAVP